MPSTFASLVLYTFFLFPGYVAYVQRSRFGPTRSQSSLLEAVNLIFVSAVTNALALLTLLALRAWMPDRLPDLAEWIRQGRGYSESRLGELAAWSAIGLLLSCSYAYMVSLPRVRGLFKNVFNPVVVDSSTWYHVFESVPPSDNGRNPYPYVECHLSDGTYVAGRLSWYSTEIDETADRELSLVAPPEEHQAERNGAVTGNSIVILSAREIRRMIVTWVDEPLPSQEP